MSHENVVRRGTETRKSLIRVWLAVSAIWVAFWLLTATMNAYLGGDETVIWPAAGVSLLCLLLNVGLWRYLQRMEHARS